MHEDGACDQNLDGRPPRAKESASISSQEYSKAGENESWTLIIETVSGWQERVWFPLKFLPDLDKKLYLASLEMKGEFPEVMTADSLSEW